VIIFLVLHWWYLTNFQFNAFKVDDIQKPFMSLVSVFIYLFQLFYTMIIVMLPRLWYPASLLSLCLYIHLYFYGLFSMLSIYFSSFAYLGPFFLFLGEEWEGKPSSFFLWEIHQFFSACGYCISCGAGHQVMWWWSWFIMWRDHPDCLEEFFR